jgi:hypothetical protein
MVNLICIVASQLGICGGTIDSIITNFNLFFLSLYTNGAVVMLDNIDVNSMNKKDTVCFIFSQGLIQSHSSNIRFIIMLNNIEMIKSNKNIIDNDVDELLLNSSLLNLDSGSQSSSENDTSSPDEYIPPSSPKYKKSPSKITNSSSNYDNILSSLSNISANDEIKLLTPSINNKNLIELININIEDAIILIRKLYYDIKKCHMSLQDATTIVKVSKYNIRKMISIINYPLSLLSLYMLVFFFDLFFKLIY